MPLDERAAVRRLLDRLSLGGRPGELDDAVVRGFDATLTALLDADPGAPGDVPDLPLLSAGGRYQDEALRLPVWWLDRMADARSSCVERMTWFWHGHWATSLDKVGDPGLLLAQNLTLRAHALGDFAAMARAMVVDPALLVWLDAPENSAAAPNENLARELMELFVLGVGHYGEDDVRQAARALTGWTVRDRRASLVPSRHDGGPKTVLGVADDYDATSLVGMLVARPDSARFVASRLWFRLVSPDPPPPPELDRLVGASATGTDIAALVRALATSTAFHDPASTLVKAPVDWFVGLARATDRRLGDRDPAEQGRLLWSLSLLGQVPFHPPDVGGWPAGVPWLAPTSTVGRLGLAQALLADMPRPDDYPASTPARLEWARATLGVDAWSPRTQQALGPVAADHRQLLAVAAVSPEYVVSG